LPLRPTPPTFHHAHLSQFDVGFLGAFVKLVDKDGNTVAEGSGKVR
jgi:hypothetical protein